MCVNCFTMISGYFGIKLRWRGIGSYLFECVFYAVGIYSLLWLLYPDKLSFGGWCESWLVLTHTDLWYVPAYFGLMLLSPILNRSFEALSRRQASVWLALFTGFNVWCGWWWQGSFNPTGYTIIQLVLVYLLGRYLRLYVDVDTLRKNRRTIATVYLASTVCTIVLAFFLPSRQAFAYNSPFVLLSTASLFMLFATMKFTSRTVNYAARSAFAVYLIHKCPPVWGGIMKPAMVQAGATMSGPMLFLFGLLMVLGFYAIAMIVDSVRRAISRRIFQPSPKYFTLLWRRSQ